MKETKLYEQIAVDEDYKPTIWEVPMYCIEGKLRHVLRPVPVSPDMPSGETEIHKAAIKVDPTGGDMYQGFLRGQIWESDRCMAALKGEENQIRRMWDCDKAALSELQRKLTSCEKENERLKSSQSSEAVAFAEWVNRQDIYMVNAGYWIKNNPAFREKHFAETTSELYILWKQTNEQGSNEG